MRWFRCVVMVLVLPGLRNDTRNLLNNHSLLVRRESLPLLTNKHRVWQHPSKCPTELNRQILEFLEVHH